ncbi:MAG TPA: hypothetical protein C5S51_00135 [Methanosarcinaceae archaeon]|nr:hypothetical protein [Methanosarcinaceae archaeon]
MSEAAVEVNIGDYLSHKIERTINSNSVKSRESFVKKAVLHYLEELKVHKLRSELFKETQHTKEIMLYAWKKPMGTEDALNILSSIGMGKTVESVDKSIEITENEVENKYAKAYKELQDIS